MEYTHAEHTFGPVFNHQSHFLILGSFPSVKSREVSFYYGHPQNRFWKMLSVLLDPEALLDTVEAKRAFLLEHHLALWDVIESCDILGSSDSSIRNVTANDMNRILSAASIEGILCNGGKAYELFQKYCCPRHPGSDGTAVTAPRQMPPVYKLPSTSPANAAWSLERLVKAWGEILSPSQQ